jgi:hypothetical protein
MSSTPNLLISHIAASQNQKEVTANSALDSLDEAMNDSVSLAISGTTTTVSQANALANIFFIFTGALTDTNTITLPANKRIYVVLNNTAGGQKLIFKAGTGAATVTVQGTGPYLLYCDGSNTVYTLSIGTAGNINVGNTVIAAAVNIEHLLPLLNFFGEGGRAQIGVDASGIFFAVADTPSTVNDVISIFFNFPSATLSAGISAGATVLPLNSVLNVGTGTKILLGIPGTGDTGTQEWVTYVSGTGTNSITVSATQFAHPINETVRVTNDTTNPPGAAIKIQNYTVVGLPGAPSEGQLAYATDGLKSSEIAGGGTGVPVYFSNGSWRTFYDDNPVSA